jgi:type IV pilus biogenesis protein CpaD/CtpE
MTIRSTMFRPLLVVALLAGLTAACSQPDSTPGTDPSTSSTATAITWSDGKPAYDLACANPGGCQRRAQALCKNGYSILKAENMPVSGGVELFTTGKASATIRCS